MADLSKILKSKTKLVLGRDATIKQLLGGKLASILLTKTLDEQDEEKITGLAKLHDVEITKLKQTSEELGALCKKPFNISVLGVKK